MDSRERSILKTLLYADIFNYPLAKIEIFKFLIEQKITEKFLFKNLLLKNKFIEYKNGFYFISGRKEIVLLRKKRKKISKEKFKKVKKIINKITFFPTIKLIAISGALSMQNSDEEDDIDLFVISSKNFAWTSRFVLILSLILLGVYRNKKSKDYKDKICLNMIIDKNNMVFDKKNQNLYAAHEIMQMIPLFDRDNTYKEFIEGNSWYKKFLPNAIKVKKIYLKKTSNFFDNFLVSFLQLILLEQLLRLLQRKYMGKGVTRETVENGFLALHPFDYKSYTLSLYKKKLNIYKL